MHTRQPTTRGRRGVDPDLAQKLAAATQHLRRPFFARVVTSQTVEGKHRDGSSRTSETRSAHGFDLMPGENFEAADGTRYRVAPDGSLRAMRPRRATGTSARRARKASKLARKLARAQRAA